MALTWTTPDVLGLDDSWRTKASCRHTDPDLFFPIGTTGTAVEHIEAAKAVCAACPVQGPCLEFAMVTNQDAGVWGGASEDDRRALRRLAERQVG